VVASPSPRLAGARPGAVLFDLDGTLIDTVADIALALNRALAERQVPPLPVGAVRDLVGRGAPLLVERALRRAGSAAAAASPTEVLGRFLDHYRRLQQAGESRAAPYPGAGVALAALAAAEIPAAVVTNKQHDLAVHALEAAGLRATVRLVVGGDTCSRRKPDPLPLLHACEMLGVAPAHALMVGDSGNDVVAARAAGIRVWCVPYGYNEGADPRALSCDGFLESLADLPALLAAAAPARTESA
jgi:phosphoglycolate phosphatase